jgi:protein-L-isoaspartate O-methyltransferase
MLAEAGVAINGPRAWDIRVHNPALFKRILQEGSLGFGESYMDGWWECERLDMLFTRILQAGVDERLPKSLSDIARIAYARLFNRQSRKRAWQVGKEHYDIGNDLFRAMLDPYMQYSCGYWKEADTLEQAQRDKLQLICQKLQLEPGMRVLDIGCGWGGLAQFMAQNYGVTVVGVTISAEQQKMAQARCDSNIISMKYIWIFLVFLFGASIYAQEPHKDKTTNEVVSNTEIKEIVIKTEPLQNLEGKIWDMGYYYFCKFTRDDERKALLDGYILLTPWRMEAIRRIVAGNHNVLPMDVSIISGKETGRYGTYEVCAGGVKYSYVQRGGIYTWNRKLK